MLVFHYFCDTYSWYILSMHFSILSFVEKFRSADVTTLCTQTDYVYSELSYSSQVADHVPEVILATVPTSSHFQTASSPLAPNKVFIPCICLNKARKRLKIDRQGPLWKRTCGVN